MKKACGLLQGYSGVKDVSAAFLMLAGAVALLGGCGETHSMRTSLAPPPPFDPSAFDTSENTIVTDPAGTSLTAIEPAAGGSVVATIPVQAALNDESCGFRVGGKGSDALFYQWGENRLGLGFDSVSDSDTPSAQATVRYRISLHEDSLPANSSCGGNKLLGE